MTPEQRETQLAADKQAALAAQVQREATELAAAAIVPSAGLQGRCHFCGAVVRTTQYVETTHGVERHRGTDCCAGGRYR